MKNRDWDLHFLQLCCDCARLSKDPSTRVGSVIVGPDNEVRSTGFNGFPRGIKDTDERLNNREVKYKLIVHGEMNAVLTAARIGTPLKGCTLYLCATSADGSQVWGGVPCTRCTVEIIQAGITEVVTFPDTYVPLRWRDDLLLSNALLKEAGVNVRIVEFNTYREDGGK